MNSPHARDAITWTPETGYVFAPSSTEAAEKAEMYTLHHGDCLAVLRGMPENSVDGIVTDPPYGMKFMGQRWDYDVPTIEVWTECLRVLKPGGHLLAFAGTRTQHRMAVRIEDAGFEIRDMLAWLYGSGFPKSLNVGMSLTKKAAEAAHQWQGWGTALKPALEPITLARKPLVGTVAANVLQWGTGALNIDACRIAADGEQNPSIARRAAAGLSGKAGMDMHSANLYKQGLKPFNKDVARYVAGNPGEALGRWPANLVHDGSDAVVAVFPVTTSGGGPNPGTPRTKANTYGDPTVSESHAYGNNTGSAARFFYCAKASRFDRNEGLIDPGPQFKHGTTLRHVEKSNANCERQGNHHPTVKPTQLMRHLCRLVIPPGGIVLDPFMGSGSTGKAAGLEGFRFVGIEREEDSFSIARARIEHAFRVQA
jgi:DNA modification methylase